jgi:hypothetical protein
MRTLRRASITTLFLLFAHAGCSSAFDMDVECDKLCLAAPGPTIPGISTLAPVALDSGALDPDGGLPALDGGVAGQLEGAVPGNAAPTVEWVAEMSFNDVLKQLPSVAENLSADVRLGSVSLSGTSSLDFIESLEVSLGHGPATSGASGSGAADGAKAGDESNSPGCQAAGTALRIAYFRRGESGAAGPSLDLVLVDPGLNLFDCMKDQPSRFHVTLTPRPGSMPTSDAPLVLRTCVGAETHLSYP